MDAAAQGAQQAIAGAEEAATTLRRQTVAELFPPRVALARGRGAVAVTCAALALFVLLYGMVRRRRGAASDLAITVALQRYRAPWFRRLMHAVSWPGFPPQSRLIPPTLAALWLLLGYRLEALFQLLAWGTGGISFVVKRAMRRPRPDHPRIRVTIARIGGSSFPSGHVLNYLGVYGFLAYLTATMIRPAAIRRAVLGALLGLLALVGPSRIYLGHHWATDVSASYLLGTSYLLALTAVYRRAKLRVSRR